MNTKTKARRTLIAICAGALIPIGIVGGVVAANAASQPLTTNSPAEAAAVSPLLTTPQTAGDVLPPFLLSGPQSFDVDAKSTRLIAADGGTKYWITTNSLNQDCLVILLPGDMEYASMTCQPSTNVWKNGLGLQMESDGGTLRAYFLPTGYTASLPTGFKSLGSQLLVGPATGSISGLRATATNPQGGTGSLQLPSFAASAGN